jgi:YVTN family beta-propeller protein
VEASQDILHLIDGGVLTLLDASTGTRLRTLPLGVFSPDGLTTFVTSQDGTATTIRAIDLTGGDTIAEQVIEGRFQFAPLVEGPGSVLGGIDTGGRWLVLESQISSGIVSGNLVYDSSFAILPADLQGEPRILPLKGTFHFDGISGDGRWLYLTEPRSVFSSEYLVRVVDLEKDELLPDAIVDKRAPDERMIGSRHAAVASPDGRWLYSLYLNPGSGGFIHALNLPDRAAFCIDLPRGPVADELSDFYWAVAVSPDGASLFAVNMKYLLAAEIDLKEFRVVRVNSIDLTARAPSELDASAGGIPLGFSELGRTLAGLFGVVRAEAKGDVSGSAVMSPDGKTVYAAGDGRLVAVRTADLTLAGDWLEGGKPASLGISPDGRRLYVVSRESARITVVDAATGDVIGYVSGARQPTGILLVADGAK